VIRELKTYLLYVGAAFTGFPSLSLLVIHLITWLKTGRFQSLVAPSNFIDFSTWEIITDCSWAVPREIGLFLLYLDLFWYSLLLLPLSAWLGGLAEEMNTKS